jgi:hypothetical protein
MGLPQHALPSSSSALDQSRTPVVVSANTPPQPEPRSPPPTAGVSIPEHARQIPDLRGRGIFKAANETWKQAVQDWLYPDPAAGLTVALKDWDAAWYTGELGKLDSRGAKYHQCKLIGEEYTRCVLDNFLHVCIPYHPL